MATKANSLAHTKWLCKYKGVEILEGPMMPDHVHLLLSIPPKMSVSSFMGYLKGKSALMIFDKHVNLKYKFGKGYYVSTVGLNEATDPELNQLNAMVEGKLERRKMAVPKSGFAYFHYGNKSYLGGLEAFCAPYEVQKTKRFKRTGAVNFLTPSGAKAVNQGDYVLKLTEKILWY